ncbi:MAG: LysR substrate-binding domain-containing protein [Rhodospirillaceae bacterium]
MDQFAALKAFRAVVEQDGFAPAARQMGQATSSLTRQVNGLEDALGVRLLNRSTRSVTLTDAGVRYLEKITPVLEALDEANRSVSEAGGAPRGQLRVSMPVVFAALHVAPAMGLFLRSYPQITLDFRLSDRVINLVEDRIDVAIRIGSLTTEGLIARRLAPHRRLLCASPDYLGERGMPIHPNDLAQHNCLCFPFADGNTVWRLRRGDETHRLQITGSLVADNSEVLRQAAITGVGLIMMPSWLVGEDIRAGRLIPLLADWHIDHGQADSAIHAVYQPNRRGSQKVNVFIDHLAQHFGTPPYWDRDLEERRSGAVFP